MLFPVFCNIFHVLANTDNATITHFETYPVNIRYVCRICDTEKIYIQTNYESVHLLQFNTHSWFKLQAGANERSSTTSVVTVSNLSRSNSLHEFFEFLSFCRPMSE